MNGASGLRPFGRVSDAPLAGGERRGVDDALSGPAQRRIQRPSNGRSRSLQWSTLCAPHLANIREAARAGQIGEVAGVDVEIRWNHGWIAGTSFEVINDRILSDFGIPCFDGATRYGAGDSTSVMGANRVASSEGLDLDHQTVELQTEAGLGRPFLTGSSFTGGFAGAMGELLCAIEDDREPLNSARGNLSSLKLCQMALRSVRTGGRSPSERTRTRNRRQAVAVRL